MTYIVATSPFGTVMPDMTNEDHGTVPGMLISETPVPTAEDYGSVVPPAGTVTPEIPAPTPGKTGIGMQYVVTVDTNTNRSNVQLGFNNAESFIRFLTSDLKSVADRFNVKITAEKLKQDDSVMKAEEV